MTTVLLPRPVPRHISYSQSTTLADCGLAYYLERVIRVPSAPNWAAIGGKAMHRGTELLDWHYDAPDFFETDLTRHYQDVLRWNQTSAKPQIASGSDSPDLAQEAAGIQEEVRARVDAAHTLTVLAHLEAVDAIRSERWETEEQVPDSIRELWDLCFAEEIAGEQRAAAEEFREPSTWRVFGRATKAWPNKEDREWWDHHGPIFLMRWVNWRLESGWKIVFLDGDKSLPAIEVDCSGSLNGVEIKGFIDRIFLDPDGQPLPLDLKSNGKLPDVSKQLGLYRLMLGEMGFPLPARGVAWWSRTGELGPLVDLTRSDLGPARMTYEFKTLRDRRNNGDFQPNLSSTRCSWCSVKRFCHARDGEMADLVPRPWDLKGIEIKS